MKPEELLKRAEEYSKQVIPNDYGSVEISQMVRRGVALGFKAGFLEAVMGRPFVDESIAEAEKLIESSD